MRCAIIPVYYKDSERQTEISVEWLRRMGRTVDAYYARQSGGRAGLVSTVFDWRQLSLTRDEWLAEKGGVGRLVYAEMAEDGTLRVEDFDHFVFLIDDLESSGGVTPGEAPETSLISAPGVTATLVAHELGHRFGASHTYMDGDEGPVPYAGPYCVMGGEGNKYHYHDDSLDVAGEGVTAADARSGPGLCFANLVLTGWVEEAAYGPRLRPYADGSLSADIQLAALNGAPPPGTPQGLPIGCIIELGDWYILEFRSNKASDDSAIPTFAPGSVGNLVLYRSPANSPLVPLQVGSADVYVGSTLGLGRSDLVTGLADAIGGTPGLPLRLTVVNVDPGGMSISLRVQHKLAKPPQYWSTEDIFDFLQWGIAGRDFGAKESEVLTSLKKLAEIHHLTRLKGISSPRDQLSLQDALEVRVKEFQALAGQLKL